MLRVGALTVLVACSSQAPAADPRDAAPTPSADAPSGVDAPMLPPPIAAADFDHPLDRAYIRAFQTWIDDATFGVKWSAMTKAPIDFLGGASSAYHADLASRARALPGAEVLCHGDAKLDNFGWTRVSGQSVFSDNDFDDGGACPAAADVLHFLLATDLLFADAALDASALDAYVATLGSGVAATTIDPAGTPIWDDVRTKGLVKTVAHDQLVLGGEVQAATSAEVAAVRALVVADARFPRTIVDVARDVVTDGGSAGLRRFWVLVEDPQHPRTIVELKELATPGTELGPHTVTYDGPDRFDVLETYWWGAPAIGDHFGVELLGARFLARDKYARANLKPAKLTAAQIENAVRAEASLLALKHRAAWAAFDPAAVKAWLDASAAALVARWRGAYMLDGGA